MLELRHRLRAIQLKHLGRDTMTYRELKVVGAAETDACQVAASGREQSRLVAQWPPNSGTDIDERLLPLPLSLGWELINLAGDYI